MTGTETEHSNRWFGNVLVAVVGILVAIAGGWDYRTLLLGGGLTVGSLLALREVRVFLGITKYEVKGEKAAQIAKSPISESVVIQNPRDVTIQNQPGQAVINLPFLRTNPRLVSGWGIGSLGLDSEVTNIGEGIAKEIVVTVALRGPRSVPLKNDGKFTLSGLGPKETVTFKVIASVPSDQLTSQESVITTVNCKALDGRDMEHVEHVALMSELVTQLTEDAMERAKRRY